MTMEWSSGLSLSWHKEKCSQVFTESVFWYDKRVSKGAKGVWKEEKMDIGFAKQMEKLIQGSLGELLSTEEAAEVRSRIETV